MPAEFERKDGHTIIRVAGEMTVYAANEIKKVFQDALKAGDDAVQLDLARVEEMDTAGLQIVLVAAKHLKEKNRELTITQVSKSASKVFGVINASDYLKIAG